MPAPETATPPAIGFGTLETVFEALGRVLVVLDADFRVIRASRTLDDLAYPGAVAASLGLPIEELVGAQRRLLANASHELRSPLERGCGSPRPSFRETPT